MTPYHYKARILPDGHLPVPDDCHLRAGEEVEVTILPAASENGAEEAINLCLGGGSHDLGGHFFHVRAER